MWRKVNSGPLLFITLCDYFRDIHLYFAICWQSWICIIQTSHVSITIIHVEQNITMTIEMMNECRGKKGLRDYFRSTIQFWENKVMNRRTQANKLRRWNSWYEADFIQGHLKKAKASRIIWFHVPLYGWCPFTKEF